MFHLGENGEISCFSFDQLMVGGGTLWTSHGKIMSSFSITDILTGSDEPPEPPTLGLGRTGKENRKKTQHTWIKNTFKEENGTEARDLKQKRVNTDK